MRRTAPRSLAAALDEVSRGAAPKTRLATVQACWDGAVGAVIAREARPVGERGGVLTVACPSSTWTAELSLLSRDLLERVNDALEEVGGGRPLRELKAVTTSSERAGRT